MTEKECQPLIADQRLSSLVSVDHLDQRLKNLPPFLSAHNPSAAKEKK
jgi:hypothetical protein